jgi:hypothetical protein
MSKAFLYPGQLVMTHDHHPGIYLGEEISSNPNKSFHVVFRQDGEADDDNDLYPYDGDELIPVTMPSETSLTKQEIFYGPFKKANTTVFITKKEQDEKTTEYTKFLKEVRNLSWWKERYPSTEPLQRAETK